MKIVFIICLTALAAAILLLYKMNRQQREAKRMMSALLEYLDQAIAGTIQEEVYDESMDAAITERLNQLVTISRMHCEGADRERNLVKSLIADISHQVRTPLTNIMLYAGLLKEEKLSGNAVKMAEQIHKQSEKLDFFMKELVRSSFLETEMISVNVCQTPVDELIGQAVQAVELEALKKEIIFDIRESGRYGVFDIKWTREALINVLDNAVKYSPQGSAIRVHTVFYERFFCITVGDQGIGIAENEQGLIFQRFYRSASVSTEKGLGIGLYLVREIVEKQNGYVKVASAPGQGTEFSIFLPCGQ